MKISTETVDKDRLATRIPFADSALSGLPKKASRQTFGLSQGHLPLC